MMHSNAIHEALSHILKSPITHISFVQHNDGNYFICVGSNSFFIVDAELNNKKAEVFYAHVQRLIMDTSKNKYIFLQLHENRDQNVPSKLILWTENRNALIEQLKAAWKADYMFRLGQVQDLPVFQSEVSAPNAPDIAKKMQLPSYILEPYQGWDKYEHKKYKFFIPNIFQQQNKNDITFFCLSGPQNKPISKISIQISENIPLDSIGLIDGKEEMNVYCEEFANKLAVKESNVWIVSSKPYSKRLNLNQDIASWQAWEVHMRTPKKDILVLMLRRKYIPPLLDYFVDFAIVVEGAEKKTGQVSKLEKQLTDPRVIVNYGRKVADSFYATFTTLTIYEAFIKTRVDSLYYDEETLNYLQNRIPNTIRSNYIGYGVAFLNSVVDILKKFDLDLSIVPIDVSRIPEMLREKYKNEDLKLDDLEEEEEKDAEPKPFWMIVRKGLEKKYVGQKQKKKGEEVQEANWGAKVARYLAYCIDGGLLSFFFTLNMLVESYIKHSNESGAETLNDIILYFLHFRPEKEEFDEETPLATKVYDMVYSKEVYLYNEKVMINLIETGYFQKELGGSDKPLLYSKFLTYMLENSTNPFVKYAICRQIIKDQNEKKQSSVNLDINLNEVKALVKPLLRLYQGTNFRLATLAAISLASLCSKTREIKMFIMQEGHEIILRHLNPKDEDLLLYTLQLLEYLMLVSQNVQTFVGKGIDKKIFEILEGSVIPGVTYSDEILTLALQILGLIVSNVEEYRRIITDQIDLILGLFELPRTKPISEMLVAEVMNLFLNKIEDKEKGAMEFIGRKCLDVFFVKLKEDYFKTKDMQNRIMTFLFAFKDSPEIMIKIRNADVAPKIREFMQEHKKKAAALLKEIETAGQQ